VLRRTEWRAPRAAHAARLIAGDDAPHGIFYPAELDGGYNGKFTKPGGFVQHKRTFTYVWEASQAPKHLAVPRPRPDGSVAGLKRALRPLW
jgi:hypothetical protein